MLLDFSVELLMFLAISSPLLQPLLQKSALTKLPSQLQIPQKSSKPILAYGPEGNKCKD